MQAKAQHRTVWKTKQNKNKKVRMLQNNIGGREDKAVEDEWNGEEKNPGGGCN